MLQCRLRLGWQTAQLSDHEVHHIIGVSFGVNAIEIPGPARGIMIKGEQSFLGERRNELNGEERIATRFLFHKLREWMCTFGLAAKRVHNQLLKMLLRRAAQA